jgi:erythromycin esterase-like protein
MNWPSQGSTFGFAARSSVCALVLLRLGTGGASAQDVRAPEVDQVVHAACGRSVALLGESPVHGFGRTLEFKVAVARRLIDECHFRAFFIESGTYDFLHITTNLVSGRPVTRKMVAAAIGGLWATDEVDSLIPFLLDRVQSGALVLGGLDDQLARGTWAQLEMPAELADLLEGDAKSRCLATLTRHMLWQYGSETPYGPKDKSSILGCLDEMQAGLSSRRAHGESVSEENAAMIESLKRSLARDFTEDVPGGADANVASFNARDRSMYENFKWLKSRLPAGSKLIVWAATTHAAKSLAGVPGQERMIPLGSYIRAEFGDRAFALGFSALSGSYHMARQPGRDLSAAPTGSIEGRAFADNSADIRYFDARQLRGFGAIPARPTGTEFRTARWDHVLDGLVVFRSEHPPRFPER